MNFFPSCCWQANIILLVTSFTSPSDYVLFSPSHVCRQLAILVADFFSSHVLYFARAESSISTKWSANCKETKGLWGSSKRFLRDAGFCLIQRTGFGIRNSKSKRGWELGVKVYTGCGMPKIIIGITRFGKNPKFGSGLRDWRTRLGASKPHTIKQKFSRTGKKWPF